MNSFQISNQVFLNRKLKNILSGFSSECVRQTYWISVRQVESVGWFEFNFVVIGWSSLRRHVSKLLRVLTHVAFYVTLQTGWMPAANHKRLSACQIETDKKREFSVLTKITENQIDGFLWGFLLRVDLKNGQGIFPQNGLMWSHWGQNLK